MKMLILKKPGQLNNDYQYEENQTAFSTVPGGDYYAAREHALRRAIREGEDRVLVVVNRVQLLHRPGWNGLGPEPFTRHATAEDLHHLWHYINRLLGRFGHVYVPHVYRAKHRVPEWPYLNSPTIPLVAGYRIDALKSLGGSDFGSNLGFRLCSAGYDSFLLSDFFWKDRDMEESVMDALDDYGTRAGWQGAYEAGIGKLIK